MLKRAVGFALTAVMLFLMLPWGAAAENGEISRMEEHLMAHWDFEGESAEERLSDKANGGTVKDTMTEYYPGKGNGEATSPIVLSDGTAFIPHTEGVYLAADNSADLKEKTEYTVFARFRMSGTPNAFMDFIFKTGFIRMYVNNNGDAGNGDYALEFRQNGSSEYLFYDPVSVPVKTNEMLSLAVTAKLNGDQTVTVVVYASTDGLNYTAADPVTFSGFGNPYIGAASSLSDNSLFVLGKATPNASDRGMDFVMDDVRFYDIALTADEVAGIRFEPSGEEPGEETVIASWSFDEVRGSTASDSVGGKQAHLNHASFCAGVSGNGVLLYAADNGAIEFGERGLVSLIEGKESYSVSLWIMPCYYLGKQTMRLMSIGADAQGNALLDIHWAKNNAVERPGISIVARSNHQDAEVIYSGKYTLPESAIPNLGYMSTDQSRTLGVWQLLTVTVNVRSGECNVYINAQKLISVRTAMSSNTVDSGKSALLPDTVGYNPAAADVMAFNGMVDELRIYDGVLSAKQISAMAESVRDTTSPTADQKLVGALAERLGNAAVLCRGSSSALWNGFTVKLDPENYEAETYFKGGNVYIPQAFARSYFSLNEVEADADGFVNLNSLCEAQGYELYCSLSEKLAIITPPGTASFRGDDVVVNGYTNLEYRTRMAAFFQNPLMPEPNNNAEQSRVVVYTSAEFEKYVYSPSICTLNGVLYASCDIKSEYTLVFRSRNGGDTWEQVGKIDQMRCATLFAWEEKLYLLGLYINSAKDSIGICGTRGISDEGISWSAVSAIHCDFIEKSGHCSTTPVLIANGRIYKAFEDSNVWAEENGSMGTKKAFVLSCDLQDQILNGANWVASNYLTVTADWVMKQLGTTTSAHHGTPALEGNMVQGRDGKIYNILRLNCEPANGYAIRMELSADGKTLSYPAEHSIIVFPGGENKFTIRYDKKSGYYLSLVNSNTAPWWPMQRNVLSLSVSRDLIHWEVVETVLVDREMLNFDVSMALHGFQYVDWCIDGEDLVFTVRETVGESEIFHNGYEMTFYRLSNYRGLLPSGGSAPGETEAPSDGKTRDEPEDTRDGCRSVLFHSGAFIAVLLLAGMMIFVPFLTKRRRSIHPAE